ncbi:MAG: adenosylcobinamide-GDP ribazoletransferase [Clostridia bacterium]|nr:adenosylcobinamide-GDP ribazoletransferase [Clostridia bacterium]
MRTLFETVIVAFAMYSALPMPRVEWQRRNLRYALLAFPLVGAAIGLPWAVLLALPLPDLLRGALLTLLPAALTGGIHLDGYADTADALASHAPPARRREILKDPHAGVFAVLRLGQWLVGTLALSATLRPTAAALRCLPLSFVLSRTLSGLSVAAFPTAEGSGLAHTFAEAADRRTVRRLLTAAALLLGAVLCVAGGHTGLAMVAACALVFWQYHRTAVRGFGGLTGDLAGWFLQRAEFWMLAAAVAVQLLEELL